MTLNGADLSNWNTDSHWQLVISDASANAAITLNIAITPTSALAVSLVLPQRPCYLFINPSAGNIQVRATLTQTP